MKINQKQHITRQGVVKKNPTVRIYELTTNQKDGFAKWNVRGIKDDVEARKIALQGFGKKYYSQKLISYLDDYPSKYGTRSMTISKFIKEANKTYDVNNNECFICGKKSVEGRFLVMDKRERGDGDFGNAYFCYKCVPKRFGE